ncbi:DUF4907 domain-containing protein [Sunxiuqinia indica]|uniref:DUF4907 domain-containing protein n=1 Tax=Sunxiuqinia indica TaxID=2692584 RepID=UPI001359294B|nr:DUF4907 domain-containing protein [Sunxiuqinia indica]
MTKDYFYPLKYVVIILLSAGLLLHSCKSKTTIHLEIMPVKNGWGYVLKKDTHVFIKQEIIPTVMGHQFFKTEEEARKVGELVLQKFEAGKSPSIKKAELDSLNIHYR